MNKAELITRLNEINGETKKANGEFLDVLLEVIAETLENGEEVGMTGFGKFSVTERAGRNGVNPQTQEPIWIEPSKNIKFKAGKGLKDRVNEK